MPFHYFAFFVFSLGAAPRRNNAKGKDQITKKTLSEITKRRNNTRRKETISKCAKQNDEKRARKDENPHAK